MLHFYEQHTGLCTEATGSELILYRASHRTKPEAIQALLEEGFALFAVLQTA